MQPLPAIELIGFLNWVDLYRAELLPHNQTIEEFFLDRKNEEYAEYLAARYICENHPKEYPNTDGGEFECWLDTVLANIKIECMEEYKKERPSSFCQHSRSMGFSVDKSLSNILPKMLDRIVHSIRHEFATMSRFIFDSIPITSRTIIDSIRINLSSGYDKAFENYLSKLDGTSAKAIKGFLSFFLEQAEPNTKNDNIPVAVVKKYIREYVDDCFFNRHLSESKKQELRSTLERAFFDGEQSSSIYFTRITSVRKTSDRYLERRSRYKCVFLSEGPEFYLLVEEHWKTLNEYSGDYLDIFYNPDELLIKGYQTAEKLDIRGSVDKYPSIFLWTTSIKEGRMIPVGQLQCDDLLSLVKFIVDDIARKISFEDVVQSAITNVEKMVQVSTGSELLQKKLLDSLHLACMQLQSNKVVFGSAAENQRNTQIRDLLGNLLCSPIDINSREYQFSVLDQSLQGLSGTGKTFGELDLLIKLDHYPYAIIEGINIQSGGGGNHWKRTVLDEHIRRLGNYDQNGLKRNIILIYSNSDNYKQFYESLMNSLKTSRSYYRINGERIFDIQDMSNEFENETANVRVIKSIYLYTGLERELFIFVVRF